MFWRKSKKRTCKIVSEIVHDLATETIYYTIIDTTDWIVASPGISDYRATLKLLQDLEKG